MRFISFVTIFMFALSSGCAKKVMPVHPDFRSHHGAQTGSSFTGGYNYDYNSVAISSADSNQFLISNDYPRPTHLTREFNKPDLAINWGEDKSVLPVTKLRTTATTDPPTGVAVNQAPAIDATTSSLILSPKTRETIITETVPAHETAPPAQHNNAEILETSCLPSPVMFPLDSASLSEIEKKKLNDSLSAIKKNRVIKVKGYTCDLGTKEHNDSLALDRAHTVARFLDDNGVKAAEITGEGKCCYLSDIKEDNRRVEIKCLN